MTKRSPKVRQEGIFERWKRNRLSVLVDSLVEALEHNPLSHAVVCCCCHIGSLQMGEISNLNLNMWMDGGVPQYQQE